MPIQDDEGIHGLDNGDVTIDQETVVGRPRGRQDQVCHYMSQFILQLTFHADAPGCIHGARALEKA